LDFKVCRDFLIEEYISGDEFSVEIFMSKGKALFASVTEKITTESPSFVELGHVVPTSVHTDKVNELVDASTKAMLAIGLNDGPAHIELRLSPRGPLIIETNARPGGDQIARQLLINALGVNVFDATLAFYLDEPVAIKKTKNISSAIAYLVAKQNGQLQKINGLENVLNNPNVIAHILKFEKKQIVSIPKSSDDRLGYIIVNAPTPQEAKAKAFEIINSIELEIIS